MNRCASWPASATTRRTSSCAYSRRSCPSRSHAARIRVAEADEQVRERRLAGSARAEERDAAAGQELEVDAVEHPGAVRRIANADALQPQRGASLGGAAVARDRARPGRGRSARTAALPQHPCRPDAVPRAGSDRTPSNDASVRSASIPSRTPSSRPPVTAGTAAARTAAEPTPASAVTAPSPAPALSASRTADRRWRRSASSSAVQPLARRSVGDELGQGAEQLDHAAGELGALHRAPSRGGAGRAHDAERDRDGAEHERDREREAGLRREQGGREHRARSDDQRDERRRGDADEQVLERVDVGDEPAQQVAETRAAHARPARAARDARRRRRGPGPGSGRTRRGRPGARRSGAARARARRTARRRWRPSSERISGRVAAREMR